MADDAKNQPVGELIDIELPIEPGVDWLSLWQDAGWLSLALGVVVLLLLIIRYSRWIDHSLMMSPFVLRWHLYRVRKLFNSRSEPHLTPAQCRPLYDWISLLNRVLNRAKQSQNPSLDTAEIEDSLVAVRAKCEAMVFSNDPVSRETYRQVLAEASILLNKTLYYRFVYGCIQSVFKHGKKV